MVILFIPVIVKIIRQYNNMINEKILYLKSRITNLENDIKNIKRKKKGEKIV